MILTEHTATQLSTGAMALTLFSTILGGHLTASYILFTPGFRVLEIFIAIAIGLVVLNGIYFLLCFGCIFMNIPNRPLLLKTALSMLVNIPVAMGYLAIVIEAAR